MSRTQKTHTTNTAVETDVAAPDKAAQPEIDVEALLDEIDDVLEENAEIFVAEYVQKGGQ